MASALVLLLLFWLAKNAQVEGFAYFMNIALIGVTLGAVYALVALGYTLVYGILELINFAHGDVFMMGGMISATMIISVFNLGAHNSTFSVVAAVAVSLLVAMAGCGLLNATIERIAYRPLRHAPRLAPLITAIGMSFVLEDIAILWKHPSYVQTPSVLPHGNVFSISGVTYTWEKLIVVLITIPVLLALVWLVQRTRQGKAMRATAQDREAAAMMGINVNRTISFTFALAGALAGAGGLLYALYFNEIRYDTGYKLGLIAFTAAVLGGIGNLPGAVLGALVIGFIQAFNEGLTWHSPGSDWTESIVFSILILILVFRPSGLLGEQTPEGG
ncbi:MAG: branched-chain amino acid ABC transporter permease [Actinobacteria bacterium]|nr:branched-chain amino acid ABC transporter permease [Actinomycetota bacterium]MBV8562956.1 branched-chain amino acid ABC transporter permease [Actinomycetota bacterium]